MKKLIFAFLLLFLAVEGYSQNSGFGIKAGLSSTKVDFKNEQIVPNDAQTGYHVGIFGRFGNSLYIQPELLFTQTSGGFTINSPGEGGSEKFKANFNRLDIPVMVGFRMFKIIRLMAGPIASININSEIKDAVDTVQDVDFNSSTLGYQAGLGVDIGNLSVDAKYEGGLSSVTENIGSFTTDNRINQWVLSVGFKLF
ncbi:porin family protein [Algoriphagus litoralis]|uniref:porin family protein n=1 Tax=Algoriphagus litoralis TaxID=2202829 RepID=UPI000DBABF1C|nr:porin family protein [Algoriphagus litoralis]